LAPSYPGAADASSDRGSQVCNAALIEQQRIDGKVHAASNNLE
jgi:hypothetical protein